MTHKTCHNATNDKTHHNATTLPTHPTNDKTHPNATPSCAQDPPQCHHNKDYHNHISEDDNSNDNGAGDNSSRMAVAGVVTRVGLPVHILIYSNKIIFLYFANYVTNFINL